MSPGKVHDLDGVVNLGTSGWAARRVAAFSDDMIRAIVHTGELNDPVAERAIGDIMITGNMRRGHGQSGPTFVSTPMCGSWWGLNGCLTLPRSSPRTSGPRGDRRAGGGWVHNRTRTIAWTIMRSGLSSSKTTSLIWRTNFCATIRNLARAVRARASLDAVTRSSRCDESWRHHGCPGNGATRHLAFADEHRGGAGSPALSWRHLSEEQCARIGGAGNGALTD